MCAWHSEIQTSRTLPRNKRKQSQEWHISLAQDRRAKRAKTALSLATNIFPVNCCTQRQWRFTKGFAIKTGVINFSNLQVDTAPPFRPQASPVNTLRKNRVSNQHLARGPHRHQINRSTRAREIRGFAYKMVYADDNKVTGHYYTITLPLLDIDGYRHIPASITCRPITRRIFAASDRRRGLSDAARPRKPCALLSLIPRSR